MKKVLIAFDGTSFSEGAFAFAKWLNQKEKILLTGVFLPQVTLANLWSMSGGAMSGSVFIPLMEDEDAEKVADNITKFTDLCEENNIDHKVHKDFNGFAIQELMNESRFADLLILGSEKFYESSGQAMDFLEDALHGVECPVIVVPEQFDLPNNIILAYDGEKSSVFAAKQFAYLFPQLCSLPAMMIYADRKDDGYMPAEKNMEEWAAVHYPELTMAKLDEDGKKYFADWFRSKKSSVLVTGSFGRSAFSRVFRRSFTSDIIRLRTTPVFIAHS